MKIPLTKTLLDVETLNRASLYYYTYTDNMENMVIS